jgi:hypothetical protein
LAKAKKKRLSKEIDKLWRAGKYWEWLKLVEQEGLVKAQPAQWQEAWHNLCRWALRLPGHLEEFWQRLSGLKHIPDTPDIVLIRQLKDFLEDKDVRPAIAALTGLSPAAQLLREKLLSWSWESAQDKKIGRILKIMITQPEKVTGRTFTELGTLLAPTPLSETIQSLSQTITQVRKFNSKTAKSNRNWGGLADLDLKNLDNRLDWIAGSLDPALREVLLYPLIYQAVQLFERLVAREDFGELAHLAAVIPFLFSQAAGSQAEYLKNRCRHLSGEIATEQEAIDYLTQALPQDLETKVAALGKVRLALKSLDPSERLLREFNSFYQRVLDQIGRKQKELSPREKINLMRVMDPIIFMDLEWLPDDPYELRFFLNKSIGSGCGGALICTLTLLTPELTSDRGLKQKALANLEKLPYPGDKQLNRVLENLDEPIFPYVRLIKPLLELYPTEINLRKFLFDRVLDEAKTFLLINARGIDEEKLVNINKGLMKFIQDTIRTFNNDVNDLDNYEEVVVLKDLLECFPEGYLTTNGYRSLLLKIYGRRQSFDYLFSQIDNYLLKVPGTMHGPDEIFFNFAAGDWLDKQDELLFDFVIDNLDDLQTAPLDTIQLVVDRFCQPEFMQPKGLNFFLSLSNRLEGRIKVGEWGAEALQHRIMSLLLKYRQTRTRSRRARR